MREARVDGFSRIDRRFGSLCLDRFHDLFEEVSATRLSELDAEQAAACCADDLTPAFEGLLGEVRRLGLPERVMLADLRPILARRAPSKVA